MDDHHLIILPDNHRRRLPPIISLSYYSRPLAEAKSTGMIFEPLELRRGCREL
jgi:hypothetical protein